jgi:hypothetical protein
MDDEGDEPPDEQRAPAAPAAPARARGFTPWRALLPFRGRAADLPGDEFDEEELEEPQARPERDARPRPEAPAVARRDAEPRDEARRDVQRRDVAPYDEAPHDEAPHDEAPYEEAAEDEEPLDDEEERESASRFDPFGDRLWPKTRVLLAGAAVVAALLVGSSLLRRGDGVAATPRDRASTGETMRAEPAAPTTAVVEEGATRRDRASSDAGSTRTNGAAARPIPPVATRQAPGRNTATSPPAVTPSASSPRAPVASGASRQAGALGQAGAPSVLLSGAALRALDSAARVPSDPIGARGSASLPRRDRIVSPR